MGVALAVALILVVAGSAPVQAEFKDPAASWSLVDVPNDPINYTSNWTPYEVNGTALYDAEGGSSTDTTFGTASFSSDQDIASGWPEFAPVSPDPITCTNYPPDTQCGTKISAFFYYHDGGTGITNDVLFIRMRVDGDPRGSSTVGFGQFHWNFLLDIEETNPPFPLPLPTPDNPDGIKELWIDVFGGFNGGNKADQLRILYENNALDTITNDSGAGDAGNACGGNATNDGTGTFINSFIACSADDLFSDTDCTDGVSVNYSHTRVVAVVDLDPTDLTGEFYVDVQVPVTALTDNSGCYSGPTKLTDPDIVVGGAPVVSDPSDFKLMYSTSNSNTDPLQKDFVDDDFGDVFTTPVTLASVEARRTGGGVRFEWTTATETSNAGFYLEELTDEGWRRVNRRLIPSHVIDSAAPQHYVHKARGVTGTTFRVVDVSTSIRERSHGPFELGRTHGRPATAEPINWGAIRSEHAVKSRIRRERSTAATRARLQELTSPAGRGNQSRQVLSRGPVCELWVDETGIYRVSSAQLAAAGCDLSAVTASAIALTNRGESVPIRVASKGRRFGAGSFVEFYGEAEDSIYTRTNVYRLHVDERLASRVVVDRRPTPVAATAPRSYFERALIDDNNDYFFVSPTGDPWYDTMLLAFDGEPVELDFELPMDHVAAGWTTLNVRLWGVTNWPEQPDHHVQVLLNGRQVADERFDGLVDVPLSIQVAAGFLRKGSNTLTLRMPGDTGVAFDMVVLDTYGIEYSRRFVAREGRLAFEGRAEVYEVGGLASDEIVVYRLTELPSGLEVSYSPRVEVTAEGRGFRARFAGSRWNAPGRYLVTTASRLLTPAIEPARPEADITSDWADFLMISHPSFIEDLAPLVEAREAQGWTVKVVDVEDVYSQFSGGVFDAYAIQAYIAHAVAEMGVRAVLLVGGDTFDYLDYLGLGSLSFIPSLYTDTGSDAFFTPSDPLMADVDGDRVPDVAIGRFPVRTSAELAAVVGKTLDYETGGHLYTSVFAADGNEPFTPFTQTTAALIDSLPAGWQADRALIDEVGVETARTSLIDALNRGVALTTFIGHSGPNRWTFDGLIASEDLAALTNAGKPTVMSQWGCWNTYYVEPEVSTMAHVAMLGEGVGAAAVLGAASITTFATDAALATLLQEWLVIPGMPIGEAVLEAKRALAAIHPEMSEVILGQTLLGDPTLVVAP